MLPSSFVRIWDPRLRSYKKDAAIFQQPEFARIFALGRQATRTRRVGDDLWKALDPVLASLALVHPDFNVQHIDDWVSYCLGGELLNTEQAQKLFLNVLWARDTHNDNLAGEELALKLLRRVQMEPGFRPYVCYLWGFLYEKLTFYQGEIPADFSWMDDLANCERLDEAVDDRESPDDVEIALEVSDWETCYDEEEDDEIDIDPTDEDYIDPEYLDDPRYELDNPVDFHPHPLSFIPATPSITTLPTKPLPAEARKKTSDAAIPIDQDDLPYRWVLSLREFFYPSNTDDLDVRDMVEMVWDIVEMRKLGKRHFQSDTYREALKDSGLFELLCEVCRPGNLLETSHAEVQSSFRWHDWKTSYAEMICRWVTATLSKEDYQQTLPAADPNFKFTLAEAKALLINCEMWLLPCLRELAYPRVQGWSSPVVYRRLMALEVFADPRGNGTFLKSLDSRLAVVVQETHQHRRLLKRVQRELFRPSVPRPPTTETSTSTPPENPSHLDAESEAESESSLSDTNNDADSDSNSEVHSESRLSTAGPSSTPKPVLTKNEKRSLKRIQNQQSKQKHLGAEVKKAVLGKKITPHLSTWTTVSTTSTPTTALTSTTKTRRKKCPYCVNLPRRKHCVRIIYVKPRNCKHLIGAALTCAPIGDRLQPVTTLYSNIPNQALLQPAPSTPPPNSAQPAVVDCALVKGSFHLLLSGPSSPSLKIHTVAAASPDTRVQRVKMVGVFAFRQNITVSGKVDRLGNEVGQVQIDKVRKHAPCSNGLLKDDTHFQSPRAHKIDFMDHWGCCKNCRDVGLSQEAMDAQIQLLHVDLQVHQRRCQNQPTELQLTLLIELDRQPTKAWEAEGWCCSGDGEFQVDEFYMWNSGQMESRHVGEQSGICFLYTNTTKGGKGGGRGTLKSTAMVSVAISPTTTTVTPRNPTGAIPRQLCVASRLAPPTYHGIASTS
ncbi:hypothetical protein B0H17DRAFT_1133796 [Mycena rosella]|uniref:Uncharacterized protein n=1 Tax=Mycena rosella TaxID=1033263 RepID=A0AAD7DIV1_MYCRO|nr:hypothetical protein B0H17DRAFT_1133796 [Mycena rosella]